MNAILYTWKELGFKYVVKGWDPDEQMIMYRKSFRTFYGAEEFVKSIECWNNSLYLENPKIISIDAEIEYQLGREMMKNKRYES